LNQLLVKLNKALEREKRITSDAAHELRTPLAAIRLHTELAKSARNASQKDESLDHVLQSVDRATHMVEQLLALARLDPVSLEEEFARVDLANLVTDMTAMLMPLAMEKNIDIEFDAHENIKIMGNETALRLLVQNLLKNAIVYTQENGKVKLSLTKQGEGVEFIVEDNGPGIAEDELNRVTERFYRSQNHDAPGCGIGLSIVDRVVQLHHGRLELTHPETGTGLRVVVWLGN
jgi:signal transduction histidine kinase